MSNSSDDEVVENGEEEDGQDVDEDILQTTAEIRHKKTFLELSIPPQTAKAERAKADVNEIFKVILQEQSYDIDDPKFNSYSNQQKWDYIDTAALEFQKSQAVFESIPLHTNLQFYDKYFELIRKAPQSCIDKDADRTIGMLLSKVSSIATNWRKDAKVRTSQNLAVCCKILDVVHFIIQRLSAIKIDPFIGLQLPGCLIPSLSYNPPLSEVQRIEDLTSRIAPEIPSENESEQLVQSNSFNEHSLNCQIGDEKWDVIFSETADMVNARVFYILTSLLSLAPPYHSVFWKKSRQNQNSSTNNNQPKSPNQNQDNQQNQPHFLVKLLSGLDLFATNYKLRSKFTFVVAATYSISNELRSASFHFIGAILRCCESLSMRALIRHELALEGLFSNDSPSIQKFISKINQEKERDEQEMKKVFLLPSYVPQDARSAVSSLISIKGEVSRLAMQFALEFKWVQNIKDYQYFTQWVHLVQNMLTVAHHTRSKEEFFQYFGNIFTLNDISVQNLSDHPLADEIYAFNGYTPQGSLDSLKQEPIEKIICDSPMFDSVLRAKSFATSLNDCLARRIPFLEKAWIAEFQIDESERKAEIHSGAQAEESGVLVPPPPPPPPPPLPMLKQDWGKRPPVRLAQLFWERIGPQVARGFWTSKGLKQQKTKPLFVHKDDFNRMFAVKDQTNANQAPQKKSNEAQHVLGIDRAKRIDIFLRAVQRYNSNLDNRSHDNSNPNPNNSNPNDSSNSNSNSSSNSNSNNSSNSNSNNSNNPNPSNSKIDKSRFENAQQRNAWIRHVLLSMSDGLGPVVEQLVIPTAAESEEIGRVALQHLDGPEQFFYAISDIAFLEERKEIMTADVEEGLSKLQRNMNYLCSSFAAVRSSGTMPGGALRTILETALRYRNYLNSYDSKMVHGFQLLEIAKLDAVRATVDGAMNVTLLRFMLEIDPASVHSHLREKLVNELGVLAHPKLQGNEKMELNLDFVNAQKGELTHLLDICTRKFNNLMAQDQLKERAAQIAAKLQAPLVNCTRMLDGLVRDFKGLLVMFGMKETSSFDEVFKNLQTFVMRVEAINASPICAKCGTDSLGRKMVLMPCGHIFCPRCFREHELGCKDCMVVDKALLSQAKCHVKQEGEKIVCTTCGSEVSPFKSCPICSQ